MFIITFLQRSHSLQDLVTESEVRIETHSVHMQIKEILTEEIISIDLVTQCKFFFTPVQNIATAKSFLLCPLKALSDSVSLAIANIFYLITFPLSVELSGMEFGG